MKPFYHSTIKRLVTIFGSVFNEVSYIDDFGKEQRVPLFYAPREKFLVDRLELSDMHRIGMTQPWPRMAFEMVGMNHAPERQVNPMHKIKSDGGKWQYNRVPYDFSFQLFVATKQFENSLKIIEQILPIFSPAFNVTVNELDEWDTKTDISIILDSVQHDIDYQGDLSEPRTIVWTLGFTLKAYLYCRDNLQAQIKETITTLSTSQMDEQFTRMTAEVVSRSARKTDNHVIVETRN